jgi:hypothetical protein
MLRYLSLRVPLLVAAAALTALVSASPAQAVHVRPFGATPKYDQFAISYMPCGGGGPPSHVPPFGFASCPPAPSSPFLTVSTADSNGLPPNFVGSSQLAVCPIGACAPPDIRVTISLVGVRCTGAMAGAVPAACPGGGLGSYVNDVAVVYPLRITDHCNMAGGPPPPACGPAGMPGNTGTLVDITFPVLVGCAPGAPPTPPGPGATCALVTTFNAVMPGAIPVPAGPRRMNIQVGAVTVTDGGPDAMAGTAGNTPFLQQGVWVP